MQIFFGTISRTSTTRAGNVVSSRRPNPANVFAVHLLTTSTLRRMIRLNTSAIWDVRRFRPNQVIEIGGGHEAVEVGWTNRAACRIRCDEGEIATVRCAMTIHARRALPRDPSVLRKSSTTPISVSACTPRSSRQERSRCRMPWMSEATAFVFAQRCALR